MREISRKFPLRSDYNLNQRFLQTTGRNARTLLLGSSWLGAQFVRNVQVVGTDLSRIAHMLIDIMLPFLYSTASFHATMGMRSCMHAAATDCRHLFPLG